MEQILLDSFAKINLSLDIVNKRSDGYHNIETIMQEIELKDQVLIEPRSKGLKIESNNRQMPRDESNLVYKAWERMKEASGLEKGAYIYIDKNIPLSSGLAGGSSNCAATLKGLNELWNLNYSLEKLQEIGVAIGADVPFCLQGGTVLAKGIGERIQVLPAYKDKKILLANPGISISSQKVYENLNIGRDKRTTKIDKIAEKIKHGQIESTYAKFYNIMEDLVFEKYPLVGDIKTTMLEYGAQASLMSGSGSTVFGIFENEGKMLRCKEVLEKEIDLVLTTKTR